MDDQTILWTLSFIPLSLVRYNDTTFCNGNFSGASCCQRLAHALRGDEEMILNVSDTLTSINEKYAIAALVK